MCKYSKCTYNKKYFFRITRCLNPPPDLFRQQAVGLYLFCGAVCTLAVELECSVYQGTQYYALKTHVFLYIDSVVLQPNFLFK